jgi:cell fate (sporulation/competence/biofilm development) regulator YlbF (YheA/YmcA/DUF963 family)
MSRNSDRIKTLAAELARLIHGCPIAERYRDSLMRISKDRKSQDLLERLVAMGRIISGGSSASDDTGMSEYRQIQDELDTDPHVKSHLLAQREYLNLLQAVIDRIRNPR